MSEGQAAAARKGPGAVALVVGSSGVGKDALIAGARAAVESDPRFVFVTRHITRPAHASESFKSVTEAEFRAHLAQGDYALSWVAHGLHYGIPTALDVAVAEGRTAIFNASRTAIPAARARYAAVKVVLVDCPIAIRAQRIAARGREREAEIASRLMRRIEDFEASAADVVIDNSGAIEKGVAMLVEVLREMAG